MTRYLLLTSFAASWALLALSGVVFERGTFAWESSDSVRGAALVAILESRPPSAKPPSYEVDSRQPGDAVATAATTTASSKATPADAEFPPAAAVPIAPKNVTADAANRPDTKHPPAHPGVATR